MYLLAGHPVEPLGRGSKEKKSSLVALGRALGLDLEAIGGKTECGRLIAERLGADWDDTCHSTGDTITLAGMNRLLDATFRYLLADPHDHERARLSDLLEAARHTASQMKESIPVPVTSVEIEQNIAEHLSLLTVPGPVPDGVVEASGERMPAEAIRFDDGTWRAVLERTQGWLRLPHVVGGETPEEFDISLTDALMDGSAHLDGSALMERLEERLERAVALRDEFSERLEGAVEGRATLETATQEWLDNWEEVEDEEEAEVGGPIKANADVWPINEFVQRAEDGELNLSPSYQRADVWPTADAQQLIESVLRGIPLPSIILLQDDESSVSFEVVDGKQRLTSILRFMGHHPRAVELVEGKSREWDVPDLVGTFQRDYPTFKKLWKQKEQARLTAQTERELYFPFRLRSGDVAPLSGDLEALRGKYYSEIREQLIDVVGKKQRVRSIFEQMTSYKVPVILYEQVSTEQIHEVFSLYNKQGKHLNAEEIRNARFHSLALMRGLLATAGDAEHVDEVAPFLLEHWNDLASTSATLDNSQYGFGRAGYKRTKLLSWVASVLFAESGSMGGRSTAATINALLKRVAESKSDPLRQEGVVLDAMLLLDHGLDAHAAVPEAWPPSFRNTQSANGWQELQLVATLIALSAAHAVLGEELVERLEDTVPLIYQAAEKSWIRPSKTQSTEQWRFTGGVVRGLLEILAVDPAEADEQLRARFGTSGLSSLVRLEPPAEWQP